MRTLDIYARVSHKLERRDKVPSTVGQVAACRRRIERVGAQVGEVFEDPERSAWDPKVQRPGWDALMERLEAGEADGVVVFNLARFARQPKDGERLIEAAEDGLVILDTGSEYDLATASGKESFRLKMVAAAAYSDQISEASRNGKLEKAQRGEVDCRRSFGFEPDGITVREEEAAIIRDHARRLLAGEAQDVLIRELNERGTGLRGARWGYTTYRQIMTRKRNTGLIVHNGQAVAHLPGPPILDQDTFGRLVALYAGRKPGKPPSGRYALTGIATCGVCGNGLSGRPVGKTGRRHYWCKPKGHVAVDKGRLEEWAGELVVRTLSDQAQAEATERASRELARQRQALLDEQAHNEQLMAALAARLGRGEISEQEWEAFREPVQARQRAIPSELAALAAAEPEPLPPGVRTLPAADVAWLDWLDRWDRGTSGERRSMVLRALGGRKIVVGPGQPARFDASRISTVP
jgi:site-specific DNA recombinase